MSQKKLSKEETISFIKGIYGNIKYSDIPKRWCKNPDVFKEALKKGMSLEDASEKLKDNESVVLEAIKQHEYALRYASERLRDDKKFVLEAIKQDSSALIYVSDRLKDDKDVVLEAVKQDIYLLRCGSERLQDHKELLEVLEKGDNSHWNHSEIFKDFYNERMEFLANLREKELIESSMSVINKKSKKIKF